MRWRRRPRAHAIAECVVLWIGSTRIISSIQLTPRRSSNAQGARHMAQTRHKLQTWSPKSQQPLHASSQSASASCLFPSSPRPTHTHSITITIVFVLVFEHKPQTKCGVVTKRFLGHAKFGHNHTRAGTHTHTQTRTQMVTHGHRP